MWEHRLTGCCLRYLRIPAAPHYVWHLRQKARLCPGRRRPSLAGLAVKTIYTLLLTTRFRWGRVPRLAELRCRPALGLVEELSSPTVHAESSLSAMIPTLRRWDPRPTTPPR